jgi:hypothetical protein
MVEILSLECLLNVFLPLLSRIVDLLNKHLVSLAPLYLLYLVQEFVSASYFGVEGISLFLLFSDL